MATGAFVILYMMNKLIYGILLLFLFYPCAWAQKPLIKSVCKQAESLGIKASERDLKELEKRFAKLSQHPTRTSLERTSFLLDKKIAPSPQRSELEALFRAGEYTQAQAKVREWLRGGESEPQVVRTQPKNRREEFVDRFLNFDLYKGPELEKAVLFLQAGQDKKLITKTEYRNVMWSLSQLDFCNAQAILTEKEKAVIHPNIPPAQVERSKERLAQMYAWKDLHSQVLKVPGVEETSRREAIRQVLGPLSGGKKQPLAVHKAYYEQLPPWRQQELDGQINQMEAIIAQRREQISAQNKDQLDKRYFSSVFARFVSGRARTSWSVMKVLYSPYVSATARREVEEAVAGGLSFSQGLKTGTALYLEYAQNMNQALKVSPEIKDQVLLPLLELEVYLSKNRQWPPEGSALFARLQELESSHWHGAKLMLKRLKQQQQQPPEKAFFEALQNYVAQNNKMPPHDSALYRALMRYKRLPGPYQEGFIKIYEQYRPSK